MVQLNFDATNVTPAASPEALDTGWYPSNIIMTEMKPTKNGQGNYLECTFRLSSGPATGRTFKSRLNLQNQNQQAVDIAYAELSAICHAVGKLRVAQSTELHGGALEIYLKKLPRDDKPELMTNDVAGYRAPGANGNQPGFSGAVGSQAAAAPTWAAPAQPPAQAYNAPGTTVNAPQWNIPSQPAAPQPQQYAPPPTTQPAAAAPAAAGAVPPWAR